MRQIILLVLLVISINSFSQDIPQYKYYFIEIKATGKGQVELIPEMGVTYSDIDTLIVAKREAKKNGAIEIIGKKYDSYSEAFNTLSEAGLEFMQFTNLSTFGGTTKMIVGDIRTDYVIWRKRRN